MRSRLCMRFGSWEGYPLFGGSTSGVQPSCRWLPLGTGPHLLQPTREPCQQLENWGVFAASAWSLSSLCRVSEIAFVWRSGFRSKVVVFWGLKRDLRWVSWGIGIFLRKWAHWV